MKNLFYFALLALTISSCTVSRNSMREANYQLWLHHEDLEYSSQLTGTANQTKVLAIDWNRLFGKQKWNYGNFGGLPEGPVNRQGQGNAGLNLIQASTNGITTSNSGFQAVYNGVIGVSNFNRVEQMAMHDLIQKNPGYDLVMFPQFTSRRKWFGVGNKTEVVCTAKLAKLKATRP